ncbi:hypothetical protein D1007_03488 [Hordeum vulgare]|nr:hypothetical protein D1007_03488 [Hordeum vulgare]
MCALGALQREVAEALDAHVKQVSETNAKLAAREEEIRAAVDAKAEMDRTVLSIVELRARQALSSIYRLGLEAPLVPQDASYAEISSELVKEFEGPTKKAHRACSFISCPKDMTKYSFPKPKSSGRLGCACRLEDEVANPLAGQATPTGWTRDGYLFLIVLAKPVG